MPSPTLRWFAFPHAGGAASAFRPLAIATAPSIELCAIQPPGRWNRIKEPPLRRVSDAVDAIWPALMTALDGTPFAFWGHSLGALVAFECARRLNREGKPAPQRLLVSARRTPNMLPLGEPISHLAQDAFLDAVDKRYGGISPVIRGDPEMLALTVPALRADMEMYETYRCDAGAPLTCAIEALRGSNDPITSDDTVNPWREFTTATFTASVLPGNHFFPFAAETRVEMLSRLDHP